MKIWKNKLLKQMIIAITLVFVILNGIVPTNVYANKTEDNILQDFGQWIFGTAQWIGRDLGSLIGGVTGGVGGAAIGAVVGAVLPAEDISGNSAQRKWMGRWKFNYGICKAISRYR